MGFIASSIVAGLALYGGLHLLNEWQIWSAHRKLVQWSQDAQRIRHLTGAATLRDWLTTLHDDVIKENALLARDATIAACMEPVGGLDDARGKARLARLGEMLRRSWDLPLRREAERRGLST